MSVVTPVSLSVILPAILGIALSAGALPASAGTYDSSASKGVTWLLQQRNADDGSWGVSDDVKYVQTSEAVLALAALNQLSPAYQAGLSWLDNHPPTNIDFTSRRILALGAAGSSVNLDLQALQGAQGLTGPGNNGWGLSGSYIGSPLDTSLSLQALNQQGISANVSQAVTFLTASQLTGSDSGWTLGQETTSDPVTTAQVIQALVPLQTVNTAVPAAITNGLNALNAKVTSASSVLQIALAALANLRNNPNSAPGTNLLNTLVSQQAYDGSWGEDPYATALALRAMAAGLGKDMAAQKQTVNVPDNNLRAAINSALGHGALDAINAGQLQQLTTLDISSRNITDLTGIQYATNLTSLNALSNQITSTAPLAPLTKLTQVFIMGNPLSTVDSDGDGFTDYEESLFGTNPTNAVSHPVFRDASATLNLNTVMSIPDVGRASEGWHPLWENFAGHGLLDLVAYFNGADAHFMDPTCSYDCGDQYTGPSWGILTVLENVGGTYVRRDLVSGQQKLSGDIVNMYAFDYDNDGKEDLLLVLHPVGTSSNDPYDNVDPATHRNLVLFRNDTGEAGVPAGLHFTDMTAAVGLPTGIQYGWADSADAVVLDSDQDGYLDIVSMNYSYAKLWRFNSTTHKYEATTPPGLPSTNNQLVYPIALDLDGDGKLDIVALGASGLSFYKNNGNGTFTELPNSVSTAQFVPSAAPGVSVNRIVPVDYNRDGKIDLALFETRLVNPGPYYWSWDYAGGDIRLLKNTSAGELINFAEDTSNPFSSSGSALNYGGTVGDYDNDMNVDLLIANRDGNGAPSDPFTALYHNNGNGSFSSVGLPAGIEALNGGSNASLNSPTFADFNGDGKLDLLRPSALYGRYLLANGGNANHSITFDLVGKLSGVIPSSSKDAWGATVTVTAGGIAQTQQLQPIYGKTHRLHFGVGTTTSGIQVTIKWPDGSSQNLSGTPVDSALDKILQVVQP